MGGNQKQTRNYILRYTIKQTNERTPGSANDKPRTMHYERLQQESIFPWATSFSLHKHKPPQ